MKLLRLALSLIVSSTIILSHAQTTSFDVVQTDAGAVSGIISADAGIHIFKGIPFAAPPVGALRWKAPQPVTHWSGTKKCDTFSASPMQSSPAPFSMWTEEFLIPKEPIREDCLYLNVWTGASSSKEKRAVLVWIYGGGFVSGGTAVPIYDGEAMAKKGIVFVSVNYRVGIFGFFAHPELTKESPNHASGNYGLMDQVAALQWVKKNIAAFGGDPDNVTIAGQSAGSMSVNCLVASPIAKGLFNKAIAESGASIVSSPLRGSTTLQQAEQEGVKTVNALHANSIAELRNIPASELLKSQGFRSPIVDGYVLPDALSNIYKNKKENDVELLTGWNENEGLMFGGIQSAEAYTKQMQQQYGNNAAKLLQYYPATNDSIAKISQLNLSRDMIFGVQNFTWANIESNHHKNVYVYRFTRKVPATGEYVKYGAFHTGEVPYAYNNLKFVNRPWKEVDYSLAETMSSYWVNFVKTGNPNGNNLPEWKQYDQAGKQVMILDEVPQSTMLADYDQLTTLYNIMQSK
jgi:para-nitrobenzyl esterase